MFNLFFTRVLQMNKFTYTVLNVNIPVVYVDLSVHIRVQCVRRYLLNNAI